MVFPRPTAPPAAVSSTGRVYLFPKASFFAVEGFTVCWKGGLKITLHTHRTAKPPSVWRVPSVRGILGRVLPRFSQSRGHGKGWLRDKAGEEVEALSGRPL